MLKLDFTIITIEERSAFVNNFFKENPSYHPSKHELDTVTNYILYGKDPYINKKGEYDKDLPVEKWTNMSARKEVEIQTKFSTWNKKQPISLDEVLEAASFNEAELLQEPIITKAQRPVFDREKEKDIPMIEGLWEVIDYCDEKLKNDSLTDSEKYKYTHMLIELRRQQFTIRDIFKPIKSKSNTANRNTVFYDESENIIDWESMSSAFGCAPMGLYYPGDKRFEDPLSLSAEPDYWGYNKDATTIINFCDPTHIHQLIIFYEDLLLNYGHNLLSSQKAIYDTLNYYIDNTKFTECQRMILKGKIEHLSNKTIATKVNAAFDKTYSINYISTIYQKMCRDIAATAEKKYTYYYERINPFAFKRCSVCGKLKLRNSSEFIRKARNSDGFSSKCKECEHEKNLSNKN